MQALKLIGLLVLAGVLAVVALVLIKVAPRIHPAIAPVISNFEECAAAGNPVMESYPRQCTTKDGRTFVEDVPPQEATTTISSNGCAVAGCSAQLCVSAEKVSTVITDCA